LRHSVVGTEAVGHTRCDNCDTLCDFFVWDYSCS